MAKEAEVTHKGFIHPSWKERLLNVCYCELSWTINQGKCKHKYNKCEREIGGEGTDTATCISLLCLQPNVSQSVSCHIKKGILPLTIVIAQQQDKAIPTTKAIFVAAKSFFKFAHAKCKPGIFFVCFLSLLQRLRPISYWAPFPLCLV